MPLRRPSIVRDQRTLRNSRRRPVAWRTKTCEGATLTGSMQGTQRNLKAHAAQTPNVPFPFCRTALKRQASNARMTSRPRKGCGRFKEWAGMLNIVTSGVTRQTSGNSSRYKECRLRAGLQVLHQMDSPWLAVPVFRVRPT